MQELEYYKRKRLRAQTPTAPQSQTPSTKNKQWPKKTTTPTQTHLLAREKNKRGTATLKKRNNNRDSNTTRKIDKEQPSSRDGYRDVIMVWPNIKEVIN
jgi:hypothetical protein